MQEATGKGEWRRDEPASSRARKGPKCIVNPDQSESASLPRHPAFLTRAQVAWCIGIQVHEVEILIATKCMPVPCNAKANKIKVIGAVTLQRLISNEAWLNRARKAIIKYWRRKNASRSAVAPEGTGATGAGSDSGRITTHDDGPPKDSHRPERRRRSDTP